MVSFGHFYQELREQLRRAAASGAKHIEVSSDQLHKGVRLSGSQSTGLLCCDVMQKEMKPGDKIVDETELKSGAVTVRYLLPR